MRERDELFLVHRPRARGYDEGSHLLAPPLAREPGDGDLVHGGMLLQPQLALARVDVEASGDDQLLDPAADGERAVLADLADIAALEEAVRRERFGGG